MKTKKWLCLTLALTMLLPLVCGLCLPTSAEGTKSYVTSGLVSWYDGTKNAASGHNLNATVWEDLKSGYHLPVTKDSNSYFTNDGYHLKTAKCTFPSQITSLINGQSFTVELLVKDFTPIATKYNNILTSTNDYLALFRRGETNALEFKYANEAASGRPKLPDATNTLKDVLISITYTVGGKCTIYYNGVMQSSTTASKAMGADDLFIGHTDSTRNFEMLYRSMRFYNRALTEAEVQANAEADGMLSTGNSGYVQIAQPVTNIIGDVAMTREITSIEELSAMMAGESLPAAAIYTVNSQLKVLDENGSAFADFEDVLSETEYKILPIVIPVDTAAVDALVTKLNALKFTDVCVLSDNPVLVNRARTKLPTLRGAIDFTKTYQEHTELTEEECISIRRAVKTYAASVALLPASAVTRENVQYLYDGQVNTWVRISDTPTVTEQYDALLSGAIGVISDDTDSLLKVACKELPQNTMTRTPLNVGHRGIQGQAPENTIEGSLRAFELGANCIEMDIYLTTDGKVVVMHDATTDRTCNQNLTVESSTWAQLSSVLVNKGYENDPNYKNCRIPLLEDYLKTFKDKDCRLFIEIKSKNPNIVPAMKALINQYDMYDQCSVITFNAPIMTAMREKYPEMSLGCLTSSPYLDETNSDLDMKTVMSFIGAHNGTFNPDKALGCGQKALRASLIRGIGIFPWTYKGDISQYKNPFIWGYSGLTGNNAESLGPCVLNFAGTVSSQALALGDTVELSMALSSYNHQTVSPKDMKILLLEGEDCVTLDGTTLTAQKNGTVSVVLGYEYSVNGTPVSLYTQPVVLTIGSETPTEDVTDTPDVSDDSEEPQKKAPVGLIVGIAAASVIVIAAVISVVVIIEKKRE